MSRTKEFLFAYYGWGVIFLVMAALVLLISSDINSETLYGVIGGAVSFAYFVQKQKLEETTLFRQLFDQFNERYNRMNELLSEIYSGEVSRPLSAIEVKALIDYFNLCAEEYLYKKRGYIPCDVWRSWCNGMQWYYDNPRIRGLWDNELKVQSFYGFTMPCKQK